MDLVAAAPAAVCMPSSQPSAFAGAAVASPATPPAVGAATGFAEDLARSLAVSLSGADAADTAGLGESAEANPADEDAADSDDDACSLLSSLWVQLGLAPLPVAELPVGDALIRSPVGSGGGALVAVPASTMPAPATPELSAALSLSPDATPSTAVIGEAAALDLTAGADVSDVASAIPMSPAANGATFLAILDAPRAAPALLAPVVVDPKLPQAPQQIAENVLWTLGKDISEVRIRLNPEDLGPLDVHLKLDGDKVSVRFDMADASVKDVVQTSLPSLATLLAGRGLQLDQAQVFSQSRGFQQAPMQPAFDRGDANGESDEPVMPVRVVVRRGLVDDYV